MENRHDDTPVINEYTYYVFERIEERGLQFAIPDQWRPLYRAFLKERKRRRNEAASAIVNAFQRITDAFIEHASNRSKTGSYQDDFGDKGAAAREENSKANTGPRLLEE